MNESKKERKLHTQHYIKKQIADGLSYSLTPIRSKTKRRKEQLEAKYARLLLATDFVKALKPLLFISYRFSKVSYYRCAVQQVLHWITGIPPDYRINYRRVLVATGNRPCTDRATAKAVGDTILFQWDNDHIPKEYALDKAILVAYCEALNKCLYTTMGPPRINQKASLDVTYLRGQTVHTWLSFIAPDGNVVADSVYTGEVKVN
jgi:hypothetical protein